VDPRLETATLIPGPALIEQACIRRAVREMLAAIGEDPDRERLLGKPARAARACAGLFPSVATTSSKPRADLCRTGE